MLMFKLAPLIMMWRLCSADTYGASCDFDNDTDDADSKTDDDADDDIIISIIFSLGTYLHSYAIW